jgi:alcohol dehydrogenase class IV
MLGALSRAFARGDDLGARTAMANGATIARAGVLECVGNHALAHAVRARFVAGARAGECAVPLHVLRYMSRPVTRLIV